MRVLAGDIGSTKTLLQIVTREKGYCHSSHTARFDSRAWSNFIPIVEEFLRTAPPPVPEVACFAVAGPVEGSRAQLTNLPWEPLDAFRLARHFGLHRVRLINDFSAVGYGIEGLSETEWVTLQAGQARLRAPRALLGAGTGLGQGIAVWVNDRYEPLDTEGGHVDFAPVDEEQDRLLQFLRIRYDHVSYERLLSGAGLMDIYQFFCGAIHEASAISAAALAGSDPIAVHALRLFARIYGQQAGNLALTCLARGGVYLAGGIAQYILPFLQDGAFLHAFRSKGRMEPVLREIPVHVILNPRVGLLGAALVAV